MHRSASVQTQAMPGGVQPAPAMPSYLMSAPALSPSLPAWHCQYQCQSFHTKVQNETNKSVSGKNYEGTNDTMGLVVACMERRMVSNLTTGAQFLGKETNSHYHAHMSCLRLASPLSKGSDLVVPEDVDILLTPFQKIFLTTCLQVALYSGVRFSRARTEIACARRCGFVVYVIIT